MTQDEYLSKRSAAGERLRGVREERRMIRDMFRGTRDPDLIREYVDWCESLVAEDIRISRLIIQLDKEWDRWKI